MKRSIILFLIVLSFVVSCPAKIYAAVPKPTKSTTFTQQILPMDCIFVTVDTGLNTIRYITPEECGQVITPTPSGGGTQSGGSSGGGTTHPQNKPGEVFIPSFMPSVSPAKPSTGKPSPQIAAILLNNLKGITTPKGYDIDVRPGTVLSYIPLNQLGKQLHRLTFTGVNENGVTFLLEPGKQLLTVRPDKLITADSDEQGKPAIAIKLVGKPDHATAHLRIWLLNNKLSANTIMQLPEEEVHGRYLPATIIVILIALIFNVSHFHRGKIRK